MTDQLLAAPPPPATRRRVWPWVLIGLVLLAVASVVLSRPLWEPVVSEVAGTGADDVAYVSKAYGFTATYPEDPTVESHTDTSMGFEVSQTTFAVERSTEAFAVSVVDSSTFEIPDPATLSAADLELLLKSSLDGAVANIPGGVLADHRFDDLGASRAVIADIDTAEGPATLAIVIADDEYYIILAAGSPADVAAFIGSFELV